jgi:hypothetical protein
MSAASSRSKSAVSGTSTGSSPSARDVMPYITKVGVGNSTVARGRPARGWLQAVISMAMTSSLPEPST